MYTNSNLVIKKRKKKINCIKKKMYLFVMKSIFDTLHVQSTHSFLTNNKPNTLNDAAQKIDATIFNR